MMRAITRVWFSSLALAGAAAGLVLLAGVFAAGVFPYRTGPAASTPQAFWLYLDTLAARSTAPPALGEAALERRRQQGIPIFPGDRPLPVALLDRIRATGAGIRVESRWLRAVSVDATPAQLRALRQLPFVRRIERVRKLRVAGGPTSQSGAVRVAPAADSRPATSPDNDSAYYGVNYRALARLGIPLVHAPPVSLSGVGIVIAILDTGFERQHVALRERIVGRQYDFINGDSIVANEPGDPVGTDPEQHGTWVWSLLGGFDPGLIVGPAYNATFLLAKVDAEPRDTQADEDRWVRAVEWADSLGARIISSSVFFRDDFSDRPAIPFQQLNGDVTATTIQADWAARRGILVVQAVGDAPPGGGSLSAPADADSVLSVGAVDLNGAVWDLGAVASARGPTAVGITKPEVVAVGVNLAGANSVNQQGLNYALSGTSFSTPLVAGAAALFMEAWPGLNAWAVRRALIQAGDNANTPNNVVGWGQPDIGAAIMLPEGLELASISPSDFNGDPASLAPNFNWNAPQTYSGMRPLTFHLELAADSLFRNPIVRDSVRDAQTLTLGSPLKPGTRFWWRVTARSPSGIQRRSNNVRGPFTAPHWVNLVSLAGDAPTETNTTRPEFVWAPLPGGTLTYDVEVLAHSTGEVVQARRNLGGTATTMQNPLTANAAYRWRVIAHSQNGIVDTVTSVHPFVVASSEAPPATVLFQNFPNPFPNFELGLINTRIWFNLAARSAVELTVHDLRGRLVRSLIPAEAGCSIQVLEPGMYGRAGSTVGDSECIRTTWDGRDQAGEHVPRGVYVLRLLANGRPLYRRMLYQPN